MTRKLRLTVPDETADWIASTLTNLGSAAAALPDLDAGQLGRIDAIRCLDTFWAKMLSSIRVSNEGSRVKISVKLVRQQLVRRSEGDWTIASGRLFRAIDFRLRGLLYSNPRWESAKLHLECSIDRSGWPDECFIPRGTEGDALVSSTFGPLFAEHINRSSEEVMYVGMFYRPPGRPDFIRTLDAAANARDRNPLVITGMPRTGKTYTALFLLFHHFIQDCDIVASSLSPSQKDLKHLLGELASITSANSRAAGFEKTPWVFLEDPFGATGYAADPETLSTICETFKQFQDKGARLLITTRDSLWLETMRRGRKSDWIDFNVIGLNEQLEKAGDDYTARQIYSEESIAGMMFDYSTHFKANWVDDPKLREKIRLHTLASLNEGVTIFPADIVFWSCLRETREHPEEHLAWLPNAANTTSALAEEIPSLFPSQADRVALMIPQILFANKVEGSKLAAVLGSIESWTTFSDLIKDQKPAKNARVTHSTLEHSQLFQRDWAEAFSSYARSYWGLGDLCASLQGALARCEGLDDNGLYLLTEIVRFQTLESARRIGRKEIAADLWLTPSGTTAIREVAQQENVARQRERTLCLLSILQLVERAVHDDGVRPEDSGWQEVVDHIRGGNQIVLSAAGHCLGDVLRLPFALKILDGGFERVIGHLTGLAEGKGGPSNVDDDWSKAFLATMTVSLVLGSIVEPLGEQVASDVFVLKHLEALKTCRPMSRMGLASWLTWADILVWKIGNLIRFLEDPGLNAIASDIDADHLERVLRWMTAQLTSQNGDLFGPQGSDQQAYCLGWMLFTLMWHNDWNYQHQIVEGISGNAAIGDAISVIERLWRIAFDSLSSESHRLSRQRLLDGCFDNAAYHCAYHHFQATEWARRTAVRPSAREMVRLGSETHQEVGIARGRSANRRIWDQQEEVWQTLLAEGEERRSQLHDATWGGIPDVRGCFYSLTLLRGCRAANKYESPGEQDPHGRFRDWWIAKLSSMDGHGARCFDRDLWMVVLDLLRQGFNPFPSEPSFSPQLESGVRELWKEMSDELIRVIPSDAFIEQVDGVLNRWFGTTKGSSHAN